MHVAIIKIQFDKSARCKTSPDRNSNSSYHPRQSAHTCQLIIGRKTHCNQSAPIDTISTVLASHRFVAGRPPPCRSSADQSSLADELSASMDIGIDNNANGVVEVETETIDEVEFGNDTHTGENSIQGVFHLGQDNANQISVARELSASVNGDEPYVGQEFDSESAAHAYYNVYAARVGFVTRVSKVSRSRRDGSVIGRSLVCNKEGYRQADRREKVLRQRAVTRVGCKAMVLLRKLNSEKWTVTKFVSEHNHALTPGNCPMHLIYDQFPNEHDKILELSQQLAAEKKRAASYKRHLEMIFQSIDEHNEGLTKKVNYIIDSVKDFECREQQNHI